MGISAETVTAGPNLTEQMDPGMNTHLQISIYTKKINERCKNFKTNIPFTVFVKLVFSCKI